MMWIRLPLGVGKSLPVMFGGLFCGGITENTWLIITPTTIGHQIINDATKLEGMQGKRQKEKKSYFLMTGPVNSGVEARL